MVKKSKIAALPQLSPRVDRFRRMLGLTPGWLCTSDDALELVEELSDKSRQILRVGFADPAVIRCFERDDSDFCGKARGRVSHAAASQRVGHGGGECCALQHLAFLELRVCGNHGLALPNEFMALSEHWGSGLQGCGDCIERRGGSRRSFDGTHVDSAQHVLTPEQHLALIGEVAEECPLGETSPFSDLRHRRLLKPAFLVQVQSCLLQSAPGLAFPSAHTFNPSFMTAIDITSIIRYHRYVSN